MKNSIPENLLFQLSEFIAARTALHFPREQWGGLEQKVGPLAKELGFNDSTSFVQWLVSSPLTQEQMDTLASHLTIGETYFWREPKVFEAFEEHILPELVRQRENGEKRLRIWSAGCASGEEPYSIAIALRRVIPELNDWNITILATDINTHSMRKAIAGKYSDWSFRNAPPWLKEDHFLGKKNGQYEILPEIRKMVTFAYLNLAEDVYPSPLNNTNAMDIIFCRNVLMYFNQDRARQVGQDLERSLLEGGWLVVSSTELSQHLFSQFSSVEFHEAIIYRKDPLESRSSDGSFSKWLPLQNVPVLTPLDPLTAVGAGCDETEIFSFKPEILTTVESPLSQQIESAGASDANLDGFGAEIMKKPSESTPLIAHVVRELANEGKLADAQALCEKAIAINRLDPGLYYLSATILQEQNKEGDAVASLKRALYIDPDFVLAHFAMGTLAMRRGDARTARKCFDNVLTLLSSHQQDDVLLECEGLTAGRLREIVIATLQVGALT
jgi:chemotaxis protein methyltransferase CheR